jgi:hypothetical protein
LAIDASTGNVIWNHEDDYAGVPIMTTSSKRLLFASMSGPSVEAIQGRELVLNELENNGVRARSWHARFRSVKMQSRLFQELVNGFGVSAYSYTGKSVVASILDTCSPRKERLRIRIDDDLVTVDSGHGKTRFNALKR